MVDNLVEPNLGLAPEVLEALCEADRLQALALSAEDAADNADLAALQRML